MSAHSRQKYNIVVSLAHLVTVLTLMQSLCVIAFAVTLPST